ncbi:HAD family hydrolase [Endozoicomonas euniceicola]|uniref:Haloacid dehalogenase-like hydrolase n=1 Tax=Endozoicomonas euniceicola TaxID=1234143 RepID=A0ABY6GQ88_9GAMM|nr:HAD family hydrolase [Endozoicomonas euniceicola]UYM14913.1 haloacid dehalogenase-like hydrolase [Endozoicomonas euniceicola]
MSNTLVLFDFDETIIKENSVKKLLHAASGRRFLWPIAIPALVDFSGWKQLRQNIKNRVYNECLYALSDTDQYHFGRAFGIRFTLNSEVWEKMKYHHEQGHTIWIVTASPQPYVKGLAEALSLPCELVIGTRLPSTPELFDLTEIECSGGKKVDEVNAQLAKGAFCFNTILAYGNLPWDREMLSMAHEGYVVTNGRVSKYGRD